MPLEVQVHPRHPRHAPHPHPRPSRVPCTSSLLVGGACRQTLQHRDVIHALSSEKMYSFLHDINSRAMAAENEKISKRRCDA